MEQTTIAPASHWFHGIENLTQDGQGFVNWKGRHVEHYSYHNKEEERQAAEKLADDCKKVEAMGFTPTASTLWAYWQGEPIQEPEHLDPPGTSYFSCGCCGNMFKSTYDKQEPFGQDAGYGICDRCEHYYK